MLVRCWIVLVAAVLVIVLKLFTGSSGFGVTFAAIVAVVASWQWLAFLWIDRHGSWHSAFD
jgi:hypothetical protein